MKRIALIRIEDACLWLALAALIIGIAIGLFGCASGTAKGGDTQMERNTEKPSTRTYRVEVFGREPSPEEWSVLQRLGQPEVRK